MCTRVRVCEAEGWGLQQCVGCWGGVNELFCDLCHPTGSPQGDKMKKTRGEGDNNDKSVAAVPHWTRERSDWKQKESSPLSRYVTLYTVLVRIPWTFTNYLNPNVLLLKTQSPNYSFGVSSEIVQTNRAVSPCRPVWNDEYSSDRQRKSERQRDVRKVTVLQCYWVLNSLKEVMILPPSGG